MFNKPKCRKCGEKISGKFDFCPYCGTPSENSGDWGLLGKNDKIETSPFNNAMFPGFSGKMINKMLASAMKMLEKEMQKEMKNSSQETPLRTNVELFINGRKISPKNIKVTKKEGFKTRKADAGQFSQENIRKFLELPKHEPSTNIRRLANKVVYELEMPGVKSIEDILVNRLESSIEIKAVSKDKAYKKLIPVDLPLKAYKLEKDKLVLELSND